MKIEWVEVPSERWVEELVARRRQGLVRLAWMSAYEERVTVTNTDQRVRTCLVAHLQSANGAREVFQRTYVPGERRLPSAVEVFPAADWHEREAAEMYGLAFDGHPDIRGLFRPTWRPEQVIGDDDDLDSAPMTTVSPLARRLDRPWPGARDPVRPGGRLRATPGVEPEWGADA
ncbi:MAG: NADH-quinone oxidoreductase subunit C [Candidatus Nanopelagicales bacterium]|nr:NADH-quinone oxidoreductase subunit C [Candidatus Nanopelagicales bacterium]